MYLKGTRQTERGANGAVKAYAIAAAQHDPLTVKKLANMLINSGVEVQQSKAQFIADGRVYGPGSFVVTMAQPKQALVRWMLGRTFYPDNTYTRDKDNNPIRPYDMATDTFGEFMGVRTDPVSETITADLVKLTAHVPMAGTVAANAAGGHPLSARLNDTIRAVNLLLEKGVAVRRVARAGDGLRPATSSSRGGSSGGARRSREANGRGLHGRRRRAARRVRDPQAARRDVSALRRRQHGRGLDAADVRAVQRAVQIDHGRGDQGGGLEAKYDVIVLPNDSIQAMTGDVPAAAEGGKAVQAAAVVRAVRTIRRRNIAAASAPKA